MDMPPAQPTEIALIAPAPTKNMNPITIRCMSHASRRNKVPFALLIGIMATERGVIGKSSQNTNKTQDHGPMQINSHWLPKLKRKGISESALINDGCINVSVAAWILGNELQSAASIWDGVGHYHSHTKKYKTRYANKVFANIKKMKQRKISITSVIDYANGKKQR